MEFQVAGGLLSSDFYDSSRDMAIDIHGPSHYTNLTMKPVDSNLYIDRIVKKYHKHYLVIDYTTFNSFLTLGEQDSDMRLAGEKLVRHIDAELNKAVQPAPKKRGRKPKEKVE
jgi:hypothetical protein